MRSITMRAAASRPIAAVVSWRVRFVMIMMMLSCSRKMNNVNHQYKMVDGFSIILLAAARRGNLKRALDIDNDDDGRKNAATAKMGRGQLVTGVTLPTEGTIKGWELGNKFRLVCANVNGMYYALQGECPRCGFDLYRGDLITNTAAGWDDLPRVACPTCATTYSMRTGVVGPPLQRSGLQGLVTGLAQQSTATAAEQNVKPYVITVDETNGNIYCR